MFIRSSLRGALPEITDVESSNPKPRILGLGRRAQLSVPQSGFLPYGLQFLWCSPIGRHSKSLISAWLRSLGSFSDHSHHPSKSEWQPASPAAGPSFYLADQTGRGEHFLVFSALCAVCTIVYRMYMNENLGGLVHSSHGRSVLVNACLQLLIHT